MNEKEMKQRVKSGFEDHRIDEHERRARAEIKERQEEAERHRLAIERINDKFRARTND